MHFKSCFFFRSSKANDLVKRVYGSLVPVLDGENLSIRILVSLSSNVEYMHIHMPQRIYFDTS